jgi:hypothetical protein
LRARHRHHTPKNLTHIYFLLIRLSSSQSALSAALTAPAPDPAVCVMNQRGNAQSRADFWRRARTDVPEIA